MLFFLRQKGKLSPKQVRIETGIETRKMAVGNPCGFPSKGPFAARTRPFAAELLG